MTTKSCKSWCGLPYRDKRVPYTPNTHGERADGREWPWGIVDRAGQEQTDPAYCTAACLERAKAANHPAVPESSPRRQPVAPWVLLKEAVADGWALDDWECSAGEYDGTCVHPSDRSGPPAVYAKRSGDTGACEACAERAGVFGPVESDTPAVLPAPAPSTPTCSGPLATHGAVVLRRVIAPARGIGKAMPFCDDCYLHVEREIAEGHRRWDEERARGGSPPARVGTVPQSLGPGAGIGIWASRGMRGGR